jgi:hypothetical protein
MNEIKIISKGEPEPTDAFETAMAIPFTFNEQPSSEWAKLFLRNYDYNLNRKREVKVDGYYLTLIISSGDNDLQQQIDIIKGEIERTNKEYFELIGQREIRKQKAEEKEKAKIDSVKSKLAEVKI